MLEVKGACPIADGDFVATPELSIHDQYNIFAISPLIFAYQLNLAILPLNNLTVVFAWHLLIPFQFYDMLHFIYGAPHIVAFRNVHAEPKYIQFLLRLNINGFLSTCYSFNFHFDLPLIVGLY